MNSFFPKWTIAVAMALAIVGWIAPAQAVDYEVWLVDQSNSFGKTFGGTVYIYEGNDLHGDSLTSAVPSATIDLSAATASMCLSATGANPVRPHMVLFNSTHSHAVMSFVTSGHVVIFDGNTRAPLACFRTSPGTGGARQAHAAFPAPDDSYILVANQNGRQLERIDTNYATNTFTYIAAATLNLATCTMPGSGACQAAGIRPTNTVICPIIDSTSTLAFATLGGGGLIVVDTTTTPMTPLVGYDNATVHANGCGGAEVGGFMYMNSGAGAFLVNPTEFDVYRFPLVGYSATNPPNTPARTVVYSDDATSDRDSHGMVVTKHGRYIWAADRDLDVIEVIDTATGTRVNTINLQGITANLSLDLGDISPSGNRVYFATRGPNPLTGDPHASVGDLPGLAVIQVEQAGKTGIYKGSVAISNVDAGGVQRADSHGLRVRRK